MKSQPLSSIDRDFCHLPPIPLFLACLQCLLPPPILEASRHPSLLVQFPKNSGTGFFRLCSCWSPWLGSFKAEQKCYLPSGSVPAASGGINYHLHAHCACQRLKRGPSFFP